MLHADIVDKNSALEIDTECAELNNTSGTISLQNDPTRIKRGLEEYQFIVSHCKHCGITTG